MIEQIMTRKPAEVTCVKFTGGSENAKEIIDWAKARGIEMEWFYEHKVGAQYTKKDGTPLDAKEYLWFVWGGRVSPGDWVVIPSDGGEAAYNDDALNKEFEIVELKDIPLVPAPVPVSTLPRAAQGSYADRYMSPGPMSEQK